jgi:hypothetical protein
MNKLILLIGFIFLLGLQIGTTQSQQLTKDDYIGTWINEGSGEMLSIDAGINGSQSFLQSIAFATTASGIWVLDDDGRIVFYPGGNDVSRRDIFKIVDDKYLVKDDAENNTLGLYDKYVVKYRPAKDKKNDTKKDSKKKKFDIFDIFKKK